MSQGQAICIVCIEFPQHEPHEAPASTNVRCWPILLKKSKVDRSRKFAWMPVRSSVSSVCRC